MLRDANLSGLSCIPAPVITPLHTPGPQPVPPSHPGPDLPDNGAVGAPRPTPAAVGAGRHIPAALVRAVPAVARGSPSAVGAERRAGAHRAKRLAAALALRGAVQRRAVIPAGAGRRALPPIRLGLGLVVPVSFRRVLVRRWRFFSRFSPAPVRFALPIFPAATGRGKGALPAAVAATAAAAAALESLPVLAPGVVVAAAGFGGRGGLGCPAARCRRPLLLRLFLSPPAMLSVPLLRAPAAAAVLPPGPAASLRLAPLPLGPTARGGARTAPAAASAGRAAAQ